VWEQSHCCQQRGIETARPRNVYRGRWRDESFVHEIDISRWLPDRKWSGSVDAGPGGDPLMITMRTDRDEIVSTRSI